MANNLLWPAIKTLSKKLLPYGAAAAGGYEISELFQEKADPSQHVINVHLPETNETKITTIITGVVATNIIIIIIIWIYFMRRRQRSDTTPSSSTDLSSSVGDIK